jgi:5'-nucleotidase
MKILISNDDGVHAPGINTLFETLSQEHDVFMVAPLEERSTTGHTLSLDNPLRVIKIDKNKNIFGCSGFPADCTLMGIAHLMQERPDIVISGINRGANLGQDIYYSGTMAAAREAVFHDIPAIAVSTVCDFNKGPEHPIHYSTASDFVLRLLRKDILSILPPLHVLNVNVPDIKPTEVKGAKMTELGMRRYSENIDPRKDFRGREYFWVGGVYEGHCGSPGSDCVAVDNKYISVGLLNLLGKSADKLEKWNELIKTIE